MSDYNTTIPRVFIVRHGETTWAKEGRFTGTTDVDLTAEGAAKLSAIADKMVGPAKMIDPTRLCAIFVSPRKRARHTLDILLPEAEQRKIHTTTTEDLAEWDYGDYEGLTENEIRRSRAANGLDADRPWRIWSDGCVGGESMLEVKNRLDRFIGQIRELQKSYLDGNCSSDILIVAHGLILRCLAKRWAGLEIDHPISFMMEPGAIGVLSAQDRHLETLGFHIGIAL